MHVPGVIVGLKVNCGNYSKKDGRSPHLVVVWRVAIFLSFTLMGLAMDTLRCYCPSCGARLSTSGGLAPGETIDCPKCGAGFAPPRPPVSSRADWDEEAQSSPSRRASPKSSSSSSSVILVLCLVGVGILLLVGLVGVGGVMLYFHSQSNNPPAA